MIEFGGIIFWSMVICFVLVEGVLIYKDDNTQSIFSLLVFVFMAYFLVSDLPKINYKLLSIYPALAVLWLPVYWYLELNKVASSIKSELIRGQTFEQLNRNRYYCRHIDFDINNKAYQANIKHPTKDDLFANTLFFPISIVVFFGDGLIRMMIDNITEWMEEIRKKINQKVNNYNEY